MRNIVKVNNLLCMWIAGDRKNRMSGELAKEIDNVYMHAEAHEKCPTCDGARGFPGNEGEGGEECVDCNGTGYKPERILPLMVVCRATTCPYNRPTMCPPDCANADIKIVPLPPESLVSWK